MKNINRRNFIKNSAIMAGTLYLFPLKGQSAGSSIPLVNPQLDIERVLKYDPLLDRNCRKMNPELTGEANSIWMWYPGQKTAHINARRIVDAVGRCRHIGYPGNFCQPVYYAWFRKKIMLDSESGIRWTGPAGRLRFIVDGIEGDITNRTDSINPGLHLIEIRVDFSNTLPCILIEGEGLSDPEGWEVSLDEVTWRKPECEKINDGTGILPDSKKEIIVEIPVKKIVSVDNVLVNEDGFHFSKGGSLIADFWHNELGSVAFQAKGEGLLNIYFGESLLEASDTNTDHPEQIPLAGIKLSPTLQNFILPERCARFVQLQSTGSCILSDFHFKANITPVDYKGSFTCSDQELNEIWAAGAATIHSCMHDFYLDGIKRDALAWADAIMALQAGDSVFFNKEIARNSIISQILPLNTNAGDFGIGDYPPFIYLGFEHDYLVRGELDFIQTYQQNLYDILDVYLSLQDKNGFISGKNFKTWGFFPDWSLTPETGPDRQGIPCYSQMLIMKSFEVGSSIAGILNNSKRETEYENAASRMRKQIRDTFWDVNLGVYINGIDSKGKLDHRTTSFAQVWGILFDLIKQDEYPGVFEKILDNPERNKLSVSLNQIYEGQAYAKAGRISSFLKRLKSVWGGMLKEGYSRFAEDIRPWQNHEEKLKLYGRPYANSLCHVWAGAAPVLALSAGVLGVRATAPGFSECIINPQLANLEWVKGSIPSPNGNITIELSKEKGGFITLPDKVKATLSGIRTDDFQSQLIGPGTYSIIYE